MRAGDSFTMLNRGKTSFDAEAFRLLYLPIIGTDAFALYQLMLSFSTGRISHFLEYLNLGLNPFIEALDKLSGLSLVRVYDDHTSLYFEVKSPLNFENFLAKEKKFPRNFMKFTKLVLTHKLNKTLQIQMNVLIWGPLKVLWNVKAII